MHGREKGATSNAPLHRRAVGTAMAMQSQRISRVKVSMAFCI